MMSLTSSQKYDSIVNYPEEGKRDDGNCSTAATSKKKLGLCVISFGILFIAFNKLGQFSGARTEPDVLAEKQSKYRNIARTGTASTSIKKSPSKPELAIDGKENTGFKWKKGSWKVSFPDMSYMHNIKLSFGGHGKKTCNDMVLDVLDVSDQVVFTTGSNIHCTGRLGGEANVYVGMKGHSVRVTNKKRIEMNLKDVQVFDDVVNNVLYGDVLSLQLNSMDHRWLMGGLDLGWKDAPTMGVASRNARGYWPAHFKWDIRSAADGQNLLVDDGKVSFVDEHEGTCVKYGDRVYLQNDYVDNIWLNGGRGGRIGTVDNIPWPANYNNEGVLTRDGENEPKKLTGHYHWMVRSTLGDGGYSPDDEQQGSCVKYDNVVYLQNMALRNRWLSGGRSQENEKAPHELVISRDALGNSYERTTEKESYQWIMRRSLGDGTRDDIRLV